MMLRNSMVAVLAAGMLLSGCEVQKPSSASDNAVPPSTAAAVPLFQPLAQDASKIPFPTDLLFSGSLDGSLNIPDVANSESIPGPGPEQSPTMAQLADPMVALNTSSGYSTTAMLTMPFSAPIQDDTANLMAGIRVFKTTASACSVNGNNGNFILSTSVPGCTPAGAVELTYGVDFVASVSGNTVAVLPLKPLASATSYIVVVTTSLKSADGKPVAADFQYADARNGALAPLVTSLTPKVQGQECLVAAATMAATVPLTTNATGSTCPLVGATSNIALTYSVTTQNLTAALQQAQGVVAAATAPTIAVGPLPGPVNTSVTTGFQAANTQVYVGAVSGMTSFLNPADPVHSIWNNAGNNLSLINQFKPDANAATVTVPVLVTAPNASAMIDPDGPGPATAVACSTAFSSGYPVVIFQHGITSNRGTMLALAGALTQACAVGVAIDLPEHGILPSDAQFGFLAKTAANGGVSAVGPTGERLVANGAGTNGAAHCLSGPSVDVTGGGDFRCAAGDSYINLTNLANSRDVLRQSVIDLNSLYRALTAGTNTGLPTIDTSKISFVGMSLGSIVGETFVATLGNVGGSLTSAVFNVGGGGIAKLLDGSPTFEPVVTAGLAAQGVTKPSSTYESFLIAAQTLVDSADPINYADALNTLKASTPILFQEVVGDGGSNTPDLVVPNNVFGTAFATAWSAVSGSPQTGWLAGQNVMTNPAALGGTDSLAQGTAFIPVATIANTTGHPLQATAGACVVAHDTQCVLPGVTPFYGIGLSSVPSAGAAGSGLVHFAGGEHSSLLDPAASAPVTVMMQTQVAGFIGSAVAGSASIPGESACTPAICAGTIAAW